MNFSISTSDTNTSWRYTRRFLVLWLVLLACPAMLVAVVDPYQVFRKSFFAEPYFYMDNERYQVAGLLRNYLTSDSVFDSVVIGSSMSANFDGNMIESLLGWKAINLSMRGSTLAERSFVLEQAIATGKVKHVLLEVNPVDVRHDDDLPANDPLFPFYLYQDSLLSKWRYIVSETSVLHSFALLFKDTAVAAAYQALFHAPLFDPEAWGGPEIKRWNSWIDSAERTNAFANFNNPANLRQMRANFEETKKHQLREAWDRNEHNPFSNVGANNFIVSVVRAHPEVEFRIWFATASLLRYASDLNMDAIDRHVELRRFLTRELADLPNVKVYSLDNDLWIVGNLENYMDASHSTRQVQEYTLREISKDGHRLTVKNVDAFVEQFYQNILSFDIKIPGE